ncbi:AAA family ATPase [Candidatus Woesearchaeota archaeon]|nr:AAA family ATPase [Candidatus Woesearchaeota archaeon]
MLIGLTGTNASGKGTIAEYLKQKGFDYISLSDELRELMSLEGIPVTRANMIVQGTNYRTKEGLGYFAELALKKVGRNAVIDSIRNEGEVLALKKRKDFVLLSVDAPAEIRYERSKMRGRMGDGETLDAFNQRQEQEMAGEGAGQNIRKCMAFADYRIINDGNKEKLYKKVEELLKDASE